MSSTTAATTAESGGRNKYLFTASQWQELENQALVYKYMTAGVPIPPDLLFNIKYSHNSSFSSKLLPYQPPPWWNPYQMGYGKKIDPEPGRCRRTDGKKWRCSKEAYPDSKYCERHMHRGKNRSRKPVESPLTNTSTASASASSLTVAASLTNQSLLTKNPSHYSLPSTHSSYNSHLLYPPSYNHKDYRERYFQGLKEEVGEHTFFKESSESSIRGYSGSSLDESWLLGGTTGASLKQQEKQCHIWERDFNCDLSMKVEDDGESNFNEKTTHHFLDEWPIKGCGRGGRDSSWNDTSTTQLSISIPSSTSLHHDFFLANSRDL